MDSCNSGSLQSSSGGDEEYDSRATFMSGGIGHINPNPPPPTPFFDPFITNYTQQQHNIISYPKTTPSITDNNNIAPNNYTFTHPLHPQPSTAPPPPPNTAARNPKKRSRASRRAPTTVLTTDTTNFRAMVQEFTGIPAPPFNNMVTSSFARNRFDLFASSIDMPSYLRSSFAQRVQSSPVLPFLAGGNINKDTIMGSNAVASSSSTQSLNNLSSIVDEQNPFLGSINLPSDHQKIDSFGPGSKDGNLQIHNSVGFFSTSASADHGQIGSSNLNNNVSATFDGGLQNLITPSSSSTNNVSHLLTRIQENVDDYDQFTGKNMVINYPGLPGSKLNVVEKVPENGSERQGMVETWICSSSE